MGSGKRDKSEIAPLPAPFHAPFRELGSVLKPRATATAARPASSPPPSPAPPPPAAPAKLDPQTEAQALAAALEGVSRLAPLSPRVHIRRKPDLSHIEARRREDVAAMAAGAGFDVSYEDHYVRARASSVSRETLGRLTRGEFPISAHLDLHGLPLEDARRAVDEFVADQQKRGRRCVLVVTGKGKNSPRGQGLLQERIPDWIARGPSARRVLAFASARPCDGGVGALVVLLRSGSSSKDRIDVEHGGTGPLGH